MMVPCDCFCQTDWNQGRTRNYSRWYNPFPPWINTPVADVPSKLQDLEDRFGPQGRVSHLDGLSVEADDWHFNVRPSNTEPLLRLNLEARSQKLMEAKRDEVLAVIRS